MGYVYCLLFPSGKKYVGMTMLTVERRLASHAKDAAAGSKLLVHKAIRKYGICSVTVEVLVESNSQRKLSLAEAKFVAAIGTQVPLGYNLTSGGEVSFTHHPSVKAKISKMMKGSQRRLGTRHTEETKALMRAAKLGRTLSETTKDRMRSSAIAIWRTKSHREMMMKARGLK